MNNKNLKKNKEKKKHSNACEFENGIFYMGCSCESRNGLQDNCHRSECRGSAKCLTNPPTCGPSEFANGKEQTRKYNEFIKIKKDFEHREQDTADEIAKLKPGIGKKVTFENTLIQEDAPCPLCSKRKNKTLL